MTRLPGLRLIGLLAALVVAVLVVGVLTWDRSVPGEASPSQDTEARALLVAAAADLVVQEGVGYAGTVTRADGSAVDLAVQVSNAGTLFGTLTTPAGGADIRQLADRLFVRGGADFWRAQGRPDGDARAFEGHWVEQPADWLGMDVGAALAPMTLAWAADQTEEVADTDVEWVGPTTADGVGMLAVRSGEVTTYLVDRGDGDDGPSSTGPGKHPTRAPPGGPAAAPGPGSAVEIARIVDESRGAVTLDLDLTQLSEGQVAQLYDDLQDFTTELVDVAVGDARVSLTGSIAFAPCGPSSCVATVSVSNTVEGLTAEALATATATADVSIEVLVDGRLVNACQTTIAVPVNGTFTSSCPAVYSLPPDGAFHPIDGVWLTFVRVNAAVDAAAEQAQLVEEQQTSESALGPEPTEQVPGGGLAAHEGRHAGHTLERHVGRTNQQLLDRVNGPGAPSAASSFNTLADAERFVSAAILEETEAIQEWLADPAEPPKFDWTSCFESGVTGRSVVRGTDAVQEVSCARVVLRRAPDRDPGFLVLTAYPNAE